MSIFQDGKDGTVFLKVRLVKGASTFHLEFRFRIE